MTRRGPPRVLRWLVAALLVATASVASAQVSKEDKVKGAFIYNFVKYIHWPSAAFEDEDDPLVIGVIEDSPVGAVLQQIVRGKSVRGRKLEVRKIRLDDLETIDPCHLVYFGDADGDELAAALAHVGGDPVLTVGEDESIFESAGVIRFVKEGTKIRFEICRAAAAKQKLEFSAQLLRVAKLVTCDTD